MRAFFALLALAVTACASSSYSIEGANLDAASQRAARYCGAQDAAPRLVQVHPDGDHNIEVYRCIPDRR